MAFLCRNLVGYLIINLINMWDGYYLASRIRWVTITYFVNHWPYGTQTKFQTNDVVNNILKRRHLLSDNGS